MQIETIVHIYLKVETVRFQINDNNSRWIKNIKETNCLIANLQGDESDLKKLNFNQKQFC